ncbi:MAG: biotin--[acetyl-CoA-carboxylase] ligase [Gemmataceae bacterium]|uniref:Biotin--[acetyl-CoA-carboxylase] ligase n=1 Tax=Thermogemmata fonticola TaxID=2755323 RepID=A0A7V9ABQ4_9BACT|nr:biotin--[acetyl-CoA-carboxylase] ligase [Thermogemmata fonticola]MBA2226476.1 biotin--[acetyl-CoA-carboxylase] ligase [Thermogemmata fonticola]GIW84921.1 MAG: biotin--[acetyl-CoA-carboxylase] ligase [Gemmataceae bacterium]
MSARESAREIWHFPTQHVGKHVAVYTTVSSTNTVAAEWLVRSSENWDGWAILAEEQTAGRGQYHRTWQAPCGKALLLSIILQPPAELARPSLLTVWVAVAVADAIQKLTEQDAIIKWPNDLLLQGRKVCGILIECHGSAVVAGIGLNLNQQTEDWTNLNLPHAISLYQATHRSITIRQAAEQVIDCLDHYYSVLLKGQTDLLTRQWRRRLGLLGRPVQIELAGGNTVAGTLQTLTFDSVIVATSGGVQSWPPEKILHLHPLEVA